MAVRFSLADEYLSRTAALLDFNSAYTWLFWFQLVTDNNVASNIASMSTSGGTSKDTVRLGASGTLLSTQSGGTTVTGSNLTVAQWYHIALVRETTTSQKLYLDLTLDITNTGDISARGAVNFMRMSDTTTNFTDCRILASKEYQALLTIDEIATESRQIMPSRWANLVAWHPFIDPSASLCAVDFSGGGATWTVNNAVSASTESPAIAWGAPSIFIPANVAAAGHAHSKLFRPTKLRGLAA